jgi:hypothetical protein
MRASRFARRVILSQAVAVAAVGKAARANVQELRLQGDCCSRKAEFELGPGDAPVSTGSTVLPVISIMRKSTQCRPWN